MAEQPIDPEIHQAQEGNAASEKASQRNFSRRLISRIPYTGEFAKRTEEYRMERYRGRLGKYQKLASIDASIKDKFLLKLIYAANALSGVESWSDVASFWVWSLLFTTATLLYVSAPLLISQLFTQLIGWSHQGFWWWVLEVSLSVLTGTFAFMLFFVPFIISSSLSDDLNEWVNFNAWVKYWGTLLVVLATGYLYALYSSKLTFRLWPFRHWLVFFFFTQLGLLLPLLLASSGLGRLFDKALDRRKRNLLARELVIDELLDILSSTEGVDYESMTWPAFEHRQWLTQRLETIASCIESSFSRFFLTGVVELDRWTDRNTSEMANGVREMIKGLVAPTTYTLEDFKARIKKYFVAALASEWGGFDRVPAEKLSHKQGVKERIATVITALVTAAVPILLILLLRKLRVVVAEPLLTYLTVGAYVWAALSLLARLDPQYAAKLGAFTDLTKTLPFGRKGGDDN